ncbi:MAG: hypothetical protein ABI629_05400 [bacterium]
MPVSRQLVAFALVGLLALPVSNAFASDSTCAGDCDGDGSVSVDNLIVIVNIILGALAPSACGAADVTRDGDVDVSDAVAAVNSALNGCPPPRALDPASAALSIARALAQMPRLAGVVATSLGALDGEGECALGGSYSGTCEDSGAGTRLNVVTVAACREPSTEGPVELDGMVDVIGAGYCLTSLSLPDVRFVVDGRSTLLGADDAPLVAVDLDMTVNLTRLITGPSPCGLKGGEATLQGRAVHHTPGDYELSLTFDATNDVTEFADFVGMCDPARLRTVIDGPVAITDTYGAARFSEAVTFDNMVIGLDVPNRQMRLDGGVESDHFGGHAHLLTLEPLDYFPERPCFSGGSIAVGLPTGTAQLTMRADGSVTVDADGDGTIDATYPSCLDLPRQ